jgi:hypothetical protein
MWIGLQGYDCQPNEMIDRKTREEHGNKAQGTRLVGIDKRLRFRSHERAFKKREELRTYYLEGKMWDA